MGSGRDWIWEIEDVRMVVATRQSVVESVVVARWHGFICNGNKGRKRGTGPSDEITTRRAGPRSEHDATVAAPPSQQLVMGLRPSGSAPSKRHPK